MSKKTFCPLANSDRIYRETLRELESYLSLVREGKSLMEALNFGRYVVWSGVCDLCDANGLDGRGLFKLAERLQRKVQDWFTKRQVAPDIQVSELENISLKLDVLISLNSPEKCFVPFVVVSRNKP